jgi:hypothetical protein
LMLPKKIMQGSSAGLVQTLFTRWNKKRFSSVIP